MQWCHCDSIGWKDLKTRLNPAIEAEMTALCLKSNIFAVISVGTKPILVYVEWIQGHVTLCISL